MLLPIEHPRLAIIVGAAALVLVVAFGFVVSKTHAMTRLDLGVDQSLSRSHVAPLLSVAHGIYTLFSPVEAIVITLVITAIIWIATRQWRVAGTFAIIVAASWVSSDIVKILVNRPRPLASALAHPFLPTPLDASYPSGHVVFVSSLAITFFFLVRQTAAQWLVILLGILAVLTIGWAVLYLGVHYPSDVIGSVIWSLAAVPLLLTLWNAVVVPRTYRHTRS
jgi:membrane-associated phospholipid phosphatase